MEDSTTFASVQCLQSTSAGVKRVRACPRCGHGSTRPKGRFKREYSCPGTHPRSSKSSAGVNQNRNSPFPASHEASHPTLWAVIVASRHTSGGVESLSWQLAILLNLERHKHYSSKRVGEVQAKQASDEASEGVELGHGHCHNECEDPVEGSNTPPDVLAFCAGDWREV